MGAQPRETKYIYRVLPFPEKVKEHSNTLMRCEYKRDTKTTMKWYKNEQEFYTMEFDKTQQKHIGIMKYYRNEEMQNIEVQDKGQMIIITETRKEAKGKYKCEITIQLENEPIPFITEAAESMLRVYQEINKEVTCTTNQANNFPNITRKIIDMARENAINFISMSVLL